jgi:ferric-dicitrate binding protein FerR (iron transport regulator)
MRTELPWDIIISGLKNETTVEGEARLAEWLANDDNRAIYQELEVLWDELRAEASEYEPNIESRWQELSSRLRLEGEKPSKTTTLRRVWSRIGVAAAIVVAAIGGYWASDTASTSEIPPMSYNTISGKSKIYLPDGTLVWLHNNSSLSYDGSFGGKTRTVSFTGEAYFEVVHNSAVPFEVKSEDITVKVHGTKFNLRNRANEPNTTVSLVEGSVSVASARETKQIAPGYEATYNKKRDKIDTAVGDVRLASGWANESINFRNQSLREITARLSKWYDVDIRLADSKQSDKLTYSFIVRDEPLEEIMRIISQTTPEVRYRFDDTNTLFISFKTK